MKQSKFDKEIKKRLVKETDEAKKQFETTWNRIERDVFPERTIHKKRKRWLAVPATILAILLAIVWVGSSTTPGQEMLLSLKGMFIEHDQKESPMDKESPVDKEQPPLEDHSFEEEKVTEIEIEGMKEHVRTTLEKNDELNYIIYVDASRYSFVEGEHSDTIVPNPPLGEEYPEVSMEIRRENRTVEEAVEMIKEKIVHENFDLMDEEQVTKPIEGYRMLAYDPSVSNEGINWDAPIHRYYVMNEIDGDVFVITQKYFVGAEEGHSVRMDAMLESFEVISD